MGRKYTEEDLQFMLQELGEVCNELLDVLKEAKSKGAINDLIEYREGKKKKKFLKENYMIKNKEP